MKALIERLKREYPDLTRRDFDPLEEELGDRALSCYYSPYLEGTRGSELRYRNKNLSEETG